MNLKNKPPIFVSGSIAKDLERMSKAALMDIVVDACRRMYGEDVWNENPYACLSDLCDVPLKHRGDPNPWKGSPGTAAIGSAFDERPHMKLREAGEA